MHPAPSRQRILSFSDEDARALKRNDNASSTLHKGSFSNLSSIDNHPTRDKVETTKFGEYTASSSLDESDSGIYNNISKQLGTTQSAHHHSINAPITGTNTVSAKQKKSARFNVDDIKFDNTSKQSGQFNLHGSELDSTGNKSSLGYKDSSAYLSHSKWQNQSSFNDTVTPASSVLGDSFGLNSSSQFYHDLQNLQDTNDTDEYNENDDDTESDREDDYSDDNINEDRIIDGEDSVTFSDVDEFELPLKHSALSPKQIQDKWNPSQPQSVLPLQNQASITGTITQKIDDKRWSLSEVSRGSLADGPGSSKHSNINNEEIHETSDDIESTPQYAEINLSKCIPPKSNIGNNDDYEDDDNYVDFIDDADAGTDCVKSAPAISSKNNLLQYKPSSETDNANYADDFNDEPSSRQQAKSDYQFVEINLPQYIPPKIRYDNEIDAFDDLYDEPFSNDQVKPVDHFVDIDLPQYMPRKSRYGDEIDTSDDHYGEHSPDKRGTAIDQYVEINLPQYVAPERKYEDHRNASDDLYDEHSSGKRGTTADQFVEINLPQYVPPKSIYKDEIDISDDLYDEHSPDKRATPVDQFVEINLPQYVPPKSIYKDGIDVSDDLYDEYSSDNQGTADDQYVEINLPQYLPPKNICTGEIDASDDLYGEHSSGKKAVSADQYVEINLTQYVPPESGYEDKIDASRELYNEHSSGRKAASADHYVEINLPQYVPPDRRYEDENNAGVYKANNPADVYDDDEFEDEVLAITSVSSDKLGSKTRSVKCLSLVEDSSMTVVTATKTEKFSSEKATNFQPQKIVATPSQIMRNDEQFTDAYHAQSSRKNIDDLLPESAQSNPTIAEIFQTDRINTPTFIIYPKDESIAVTKDSASVSPNHNVEAQESANIATTTTEPSPLVNLTATSFACLMKQTDFNSIKSIESVNSLIETADDIVPQIAPAAYSRTEIQPTKSPLRRQLQPQSQSASLYGKPFPPPTNSPPSTSRRSKSEIWSKNLLLASSLLSPKKTTPNKRSTSATKEYKYLDNQINSEKETGLMASTESSRRHASPNSTHLSLLRKKMKLPITANLQSTTASNSRATSVAGAVSRRRPANLHVSSTSVMSASKVNRKNPFDDEFLPKPSTQEPLYSNEALDETFPSSLEKRVEVRCAAEFARREAVLMEELQAVKAQLFEQQYADSSANAQQVQVHSSDKQSPPSQQQQVQTGHNDMISIQKAEYDRLVHEVQTQERLIESSQAENKRLFEQLKERNRVTDSKKARYFDERTALNIELNKLRNETHSDSEKLREVLESEATIQALKERITDIEVSSANRAQEFRSTIDKLRSQNKDLQDKIATLRIQSLIEAQATQTFRTVDNERQKLIKEVQDLRAKIAWYVENQQLIESVQCERNRFQFESNMLKRELIRRGARREEITAILGPSSTITNTALKPKVSLDISTNHENKSQVDTSLNRSNASLSPQKRGTGSSRNNPLLHHPTDLKKIKELEKAVQELKQSIAKRNPNSIASLIQAATVSESLQDYKEGQNEIISQLQTEITTIKADYDRRLRSIRQEHDRVKLHYDEQIEQLMSQRPESTNVGININRSSNKSSNSFISPIKKSSSTQVLSSTYAPVGSSNTALQNAQNRIKGLEEELERVRTFYTRKVEEVQRRSELKIRQIRRGENETTSHDDQIIEDVMLPNHTRSLHKNAISRVNDWQSHEEREKCFAKISILESELNRTLDELNETKQALRTATTNTTALLEGQHPLTMHMHSSNKETNKSIESRLADMVRSEVKRSNHDQTQVIDQLRQRERDLLTELSEAQRLVNVSRNESLKEKEELLVKLAFEHERNAHLSSEIQRLQSEVDKPVTPQLYQFMMMENQLKALESKFSRREGDLRVAVDDIRTSAKMERTRIQAMHQQELREKDEQIVRLREELDRLSTRFRAADVNEGHEGVTV